MPWPTYPMLYRVASAHEEGGERVYAVSTKEVLGDERGPGPGAAAGRGPSMAPTGFEEVEGSEREIPAQLVLLAMGFLGPQRAGVVEQLGVELDERANIKRDKQFMTSVPGVFVAGRRRPRPVAHRVGDRRGPVRGTGRRRLAHRQVRTAPPGQPDRPAAHGVRRA